MRENTESLKVGNGCRTSRTSVDNPAMAYPALFTVQYVPKPIRKTTIENVIFSDSVQRRLECWPEPDELNPCEDVMGSSMLRVTVWLVHIQ